MTGAASFWSCATTSTAIPAAKIGWATRTSWPRASPTSSPPTGHAAAPIYVFGALAIAAVALLVSQLAIQAAGGYPGFNHGLSLALFIPAALGMFVAPQVALVAGILAALRAVRRRKLRILPAAELALIRRRAWVALGAGIATAVGPELYVVDFSSVLPGWRLSLVASLSAVAGVALLAASTTVAGAGAVATATPGGAGDVFDDLPVIRRQWLRSNPWRLGVVASLSVALAMTLVAWHAERSLIEGIERRSVRTDSPQPQDRVDAATTVTPAVPRW